MFIRRRICLISGYRTKFALSTRPLNFAVEALCGLDTHALNDDPEADQKSRVTRAQVSFKRVLIACERISIVCLAVAVSILVPNFGTIMAILGSFSVFALCVTGPIAAKMSLEKGIVVVDVMILMSSMVMAVWGTAAAVWSTIR